MIDPETLRPTAFRQVWEKLSEQLGEFQKMMNDPFKAPEQTIAEIPELLNVLWHFQIEWVALNRGPITDEHAFNILKEARRNIGISTNESIAEAGRILDALIVRTERGEDRVI